MFNVLLQVEPQEIGFVCQRPKNPKIKEICTSGLFEAEYKKKYEKELSSYKSRGLNSAVFLEKPLIDFLKHAHFDNLDENARSIMNELLKEGILNRSILIHLFTNYIKKSAYQIDGKKFFKADDLMNQHLDPYLSTLETPDAANSEMTAQPRGEAIRRPIRGFDRNKFQYPSIQSIIFLGVRRDNIMNFFEKLLLRSEITIQRLDEILKTLQK